MVVHLMVVFSILVGSWAASPEEGLLQVLGLARRPRPSAGLVVPPELLTLYRLQTQEGALDTMDLPLPGRLSRSANTINSFVHSGVNYLHFIFMYNQIR